MNIGLLDIDSHNFPNLALMKISMYHKQQGHNVEFANMFGDYDILYKSKVFSWTRDPEYIYNTKKIIKGGTGYNHFITLTKEIEHICPDYSLYNCKHAYGFLTRGCIRKCEWCIVPTKEGDIKPHSDIGDFIENYNSVILMDNNVLASEHGILQIEKIIKHGYNIDFNQGVDCRLIDNTISKMLSRVKWIRYIRLACDSINNIKYIDRAVKLLNNHGIKNYKIFVYILINDINESLKIVEQLKKMDYVYLVNLLEILKILHHHGNKKILQGG